MKCNGNKSDKTAQVVTKYAKMKGPKQAAGRCGDNVDEMGEWKSGKADDFQNAHDEVIAAGQ